jgi:hypothetical protein
MLAVEGLVSHDQDSVRAEIMRALAALYSPDLFASNSAKLQNIWAMLDQEISIPPDEFTGFLELMDAVGRAWEPLRRMLADISRFNDDAPKLAVALYLSGVSNLDVAFRLDGGVVPLEALDEIEAALLTVETKAVADKVAGVEPGTAFQELAATALSQLRLTKAEEKNSDGPSPSSSTPSGSAMTAARGKKIPATSRANATPKRIRRGKLQTTTATSS